MHYRSVLLLSTLSFLAGAALPVRAAEPTGVPALDALLAEAEARSPMLHAAAAKAAAAGFVAARVSALPDPWVTVSFANESFTDYTVGEAEMSGISLTYAQELPWPGKRDLLGRMAGQDAGAAGERVRALGLDLEARIKTAYFSLYRLDKSREALEGSRILVDSFEATSRNLYAGGRGTLAAVLRAQTERTRLESEIARIQAERKGVLALLNTLAGRAPDRGQEPVLELPRRPLPASAEAIAERVAACSAELAAAALELESASTAAALAVKETHPDLMLSGRYMNRAEREPVFELSLGMHLPVWRGRKQDNAVRETAERVSAAASGLEAARLELLASVHERLAEVERAERLMVLYDEGILEQARSALDAAASAYSAGGADFETVIDDFIAYRNYRLDRIGEAVARESAVARIEALMGGLQ